VCCLWKRVPVPFNTLRLLAGALCHGGTSESVRMLWEMVVGEVGHVRVAVIS
jgi:hypothetical protein